MQGDELKALRKAAGMTQAELANAIGLTGTYIGLMERGEKPIERRTEQAVQFVSVCVRSHTVMAAAQRCRQAARGDITLDADELLEIADWLDMMSNLPRDWQTDQDAG